MKKYLSGSWAVIKYYLFVMIFFYIFIIGFYKHASLFSIATFIVFIPLVYFEMANYVGYDKRQFGEIRPYEGAIYGLLAVLPFAIIQILLFLIIPHLDLSFIIPKVDANTVIPSINYDALRLTGVKIFAAPMLFIPKIAGYSSVWGYIIAWFTVVLSAFLGYFSGYKGFDLGAFLRQIFGLQPKKRGRKSRRY